MTTPSLSLVPWPLRVESRPGACVLAPATVCTAAAPARAVAELCAAQCRPATGYALPVVSDAPSSVPAIRFALDAALAPLTPEGYQLDVTPDGVTLRAAAPRGLFHAFQTLRQLFPPEILGARVQPGAAWTAPCVAVTDRPRFAWRGMLLDCARTFFPPPFIRRYIDWLAFHKLNVFHWHLSDDEGWRPESAAYPRLTAVGAWRGAGSPLPHARGSERIAPRYGGCYTRDDLREVVAYAEARGVDVLPEIDLPGHSQAACAAYPDILCPVDDDSTCVHGLRRNVWCAGHAPNFVMLDTLLGELCEVFPFRYFHIGGDEVNKARWSRCPRCRERMRTAKLADADALQNDFVRRVEALVRGHGKSAVGWNEILDGGELAPDTAVMAWKSAAPGYAAARRGQPVIMAPGAHLYFDMAQAPGERGHTWAGRVPLEQVYAFEPLAGETLTNEAAARIMGVEACLWSEFLLEPPRYVEHQSYPRICALAELGWTARERRDWSDFKARLAPAHLDRLDALGIRYRGWGREGASAFD